MSVVPCLGLLQSRLACVDQDRPGWFVPLNTTNSSEKTGTTTTEGDASKAPSVAGKKMPSAFSLSEFQIR